MTPNKINPSTNKYLNSQCYSIKQQVKTILSHKIDGRAFLYHMRHVDFVILKRKEENNIVREKSNKFLKITLRKPYALLG